MTFSSISTRSFSASVFAGFVLAGCMSAAAQQPDTPQQTPVSKQTDQNGNVTTTTTTTTDANGKPVQSVSSTLTFHRGKKKPDESQVKEGKAVETKDTKKAIKNEHKVESLAHVDSKLPDKALFDKAIIAMDKGRYDVARLDLQTMLNTYPNSEYQMRAKLAVADSWYKEGGTAALTQAESEYADFRVFFPNSPEAAEAQMRIGDIYFRQMDRPDRDYAKALHSEEEYRRMLTDYPDSTLVPQAKQRLRDVQEVLATREADIASYYGTRSNFAAEIARYQTVVDTYPLFSHMDDVLIGLGDAYESEAKFVRANQQMPEAGKARLEQLYDGEAAECYRKVVLEHSAAQHVEDAKDRLGAMNLPIPVPTEAQRIASENLENSRSSYNVANRVSLLFLHKPDTVLAPHVGEPSLTDPKATYAPAVVKRAGDEFRAAFAPPASPAPAELTPNPATPAPAAPVAPAPVAPAGPLQFQDVPTASPATSGGAVMVAPGTTATPAGGGAGMSVEILSPNGRPSTSDPALKSVGPANNALPAAQPAEKAPDVGNEVNANTPAAQTPNAKGKTTKNKENKKEESSSKDKKKKGIEKLNPF